MNKQVYEISKNGCNISVFTDDIEMAERHREEILEYLMRASIYYNDVESVYWMFDHKIGKYWWLENIRITDSLSHIECEVYFRNVETKLKKRHKVN